MSDFQLVQKQFVEHIRNPDANDFGYGIEDRRLKIYRELFFNNILSFLSSGFPVLKSLYTETRWQILARKFFAEHNCKSPFFAEISKEFVEYLANEYVMTEDDPLFLQALAHYEWLELDVSIRQGHAEDSSNVAVSESSRVRFSDVASLVSYEFPVHQISPDFQPTEPSTPVYLVVYRDTDNDVEFTLVNDVTAFLLNLIEQSQSLQVSELIASLSAALPQMSAQQLQTATFDILEQFKQKTIVIIE